MHHLSIHLSTSDPMVLERIVMTCRIRRCEIVSMRFADGHAEITITGDPHRAGGLTWCLERLVGVLAVATRETADSRDV